MAELSLYPKVRIGTCLVNKRGRVISTGCNKTKSHPVQHFYNKYRPYSLPNHGLHAEMDALIHCKEDTRGSTLYVFRRGMDSKIRLAQPCEACSRMIRDCGVKRVVYTIEDGIKEMLISDK